MKSMSFFVMWLVLALAAWVLNSVVAQAHDHVYYPSHPGAPMWSYYTGDYGSHHGGYTPSPRHYGNGYTPAYTPYVPRYQQQGYYNAPRVRVYWGGGGVDVGRVHVRW